MIKNFSVGISLKNQHLEQVILEKPKVDFFEVHSENFFYDYIATHQLEKIAENYPISMHGVGLSIGSSDKLNKQHLQNLKNAVDKFKPSLISEHLSWSSINGNYINDLLPLSYTKESLKKFTDKVKQVQDFLGTQILIENPSSYLQFEDSTISEWDFFANLPSICECGLLLDVNNVFVSCFNHGYNATKYINAIDKNDIFEIHLAGHTKKQLKKGVILIDDHGSKVCDEVWDLYKKTIAKTGKKPTLIEWDTNIPKLNILLDEAKKVREINDK